MKVFIISLGVAGVALCQNLIISVDEFSKLRPNFKEGYAYIGKGQFVAFRSCRIIWIGVMFDSITFNRTDSILTVRGELYDDASYGKPLLTKTKLQLLIGALNMDSTKNMCLTADIREARPLNSAPFFNEKIKIKKTDFLCFAIAMADDNNIILGWVKFYEVGKLLN
ncbi:MAG: hypothetical protein HYV28_01025 [Ignavibacteriales bacterium]|nr:hypothetical protein [Ignavibacteriales bacterium]